MRNRALPSGLARRPMGSPLFKSNKGEPWFAFFELAGDSSGPPAWSSEVVGAEGLEPPTYAL